MNTHQNHDYNPRLQPLARKLRSDMTKGEASLWKYVLRAGMMKGYTFNRQRPVLNYIADFMCKQLKLIIEVDGITHHDTDVAGKDLLKDQLLTEAGFHVMRFSNKEVLEQLEGVRNHIAYWIEDWERQHKGK